MQHISIFKKALSYLWPVHVARYKSALNRVLDVDLYYGKLMLNTQQANYSFGRLHEIMEAALKEISPQCGFKKVLMLGYGGGSAAALIHGQHNAESKITAVEIDPLVIDLAHEWFYTQGVNFVCEDAFEFVERCDTQYDLIICDLFLDVYTPDLAKTTGFYQSCSKLLSPQGVFLQNLMIGKSETDMQFEKFESVFKACSRLNMFRINTIFIGLK